MNSVTSLVAAGTFTCGALNGKYIATKAPAKSGRVYHNYKGFFSIILLGLVDAEYKFIFNTSERLEALEGDTLGLPPPEVLPGDDRPIPYFLIGDDAFALKTWMMKPFSARNLSLEERIFNYRLSRARRIVENAFGILANRFQCLLSTLQVEPTT